MDIEICTTAFYNDIRQILQSCQQGCQMICMLILCPPEGLLNLASRFVLRLPPSGLLLSLLHLSKSSRIEPNHGEAVQDEPRRETRTL